MNKKVFLSLLCFFIIFFSLFISNPPVPSSPSAPSNIHFPSSKSQTTLLAVGDIMLGRFVNVQTKKSKDWRYPFLKIADVTKNSNIAFGNLEAPFFDNCPTTSTGMIFCAPPPAIEGLKFAGFDVLSLANNHILNYGTKGKEQTIDLLNKYQIIPSDNNLTTKQDNNLIIGFLSFDLVTYPNLPVVKTVQENTNKVDILVVSLHWGIEYAKEPSAWQKDLSHQIIDSGAKVIIGHHPHVTQPTEEYHNGLIFYSLGNFVFDQPWSEETKKGKIAKIIFEGKKIMSFEEIPIYIENSQPKISQ